LGVERRTVINIYAAILLLGTTAIIQTTAMPHLTILGVKPDLMLLMVISWSLLRGSKEGMIWALLGGIGLDLLSGAPFGTSTVALVILSLVAGLGELSVFRTHIALPLIATLIATLAYDLFFLLLLYAQGCSIVWTDSLAKVMLPSTLLNVLLSPFVYKALYWLHRRTGPEEMAW
jgi:rod shape-determining protein MreD